MKASSLESPSQYAEIKSSFLKNPFGSGVAGATGITVDVGLGTGVAIETIFGARVGAGVTVRISGDPQAITNRNIIAKIAKNNFRIRITITPSIAWGLIFKGQFF
ncbi:MAG: hypothetical protein WAP23_04320 [Candidatus Spechtbacterales bacterium]